MLSRFCIALLHPPPVPFRQALAAMATQPLVSSNSTNGKSIIANPEIGVIVRPAAELKPSPPASPTRPGQFYRRLLPTTCIPFSSGEGRRVFREALEAGNMECYFRLAAQFRTQDEPAFCGLSTLVMVLNTLEVDPHRVWKGVWRWYHENMLDCCVPLEDASNKGITMDEFACIASCNTLNVTMVRPNEQVAESEFRELVKKMTQCTDEVVVVSYSRKTLDQTGDGHFSPIGGYHPERDLVLVLDTARFKYPPHWVALPLLFKAMKALDLDTGLPRGYLCLRRSESMPLVLFRWGDVVGQELLEADHRTSMPANSFYRYIDAWDKWLMKPLDNNTDPIVESAVQVLLHALTLQSDTILATQVDIYCPNLICTENSCVVKQLLHGLESLPVYSVVEECLAKNPEDCHLLEEQGIVSSRITCKLGGKRPSLCKDSGGGETDMVQEESRVVSADCKGCELTLHASHYLTMLLLAWPMQKCGNNCSNALRKALYAQVCCAPSILQDEAAQLTQQLSTLLQHQKACANCHCVKAW